MIGGISFSATSITSGLDTDKPINPRPGHQYLATDTKVLYVCYDAGVWINAAPSLAFYGDFEMTPGTDITLTSDAGVYKAETTNHYFKLIKEYTVRSIQGFTARKGYYISCDFQEETLVGEFNWAIVINGETALNGNWDSDSSWITVGGVIPDELKVGDNIKIGMFSHVWGIKSYRCRNFAIKCATPIFTPEFGLSIS